MDWTSPYGKTDEFYDLSSAYINPSKQQLNEDSYNEVYYDAKEDFEKGYVYQQILAQGQTNGPVLPTTFSKDPVTGVTIFS